MDDYHLKTIAKVGKKNFVSNYIVENFKFLKKWTHILHNVNKFVKN
jgi:hypothetical protein